eukprot:914204-Prymnesium_polylepis.1
MAIWSKKSTSTCMFSPWSRRVASISVPLVHRPQPDHNIYNFQYKSKHGDGAIQSTHAHHRALSLIPEHTRTRSRTEHTPNITHAHTGGGREEEEEEERRRRRKRGGGGGGGREEEEEEEKKRTPMTSCERQPPYS